MTLLALSGMATAETVYISDTLYVPLRSGPGNEFRIVHRALKTGTALTLETKEPENGYYKVTTKSGLEGFVPSQYILFQPTASLQLQAAQNETTNLKKQLASLTQKLKKTEGTLKTTSASLSSNNRSSKKLQEELTRIKAISAKSLELDKRNRELLVTNEQLMNELQTLQSTNQQLEDSSTQQWYLYGAGTLLVGLLFGLIAPMLQPRRKKSNWT